MGSFVEMWMGPETVIQSELNQKEENKHHILMHICGIQKNGSDELLCKVEIETDVESKCMETKGERGSGMNLDIEIDIYILMYVKQITNENCCIAQGTQPHFSIQLKLTQHCKTTITQ